MAGHECYHCKQWINEGDAHDCWTTTEAALTADLSEELCEAWGRLRESAVECGEQRIYASHNSRSCSAERHATSSCAPSGAISRCAFLDRPLKAPQAKRALPSSMIKVAHLIHVRHRDEVEPSVTDWVREAYGRSEELSALGRGGRVASRATSTRGNAKRKAKR